jgi:hypothetical protein
MGIVSVAAYLLVGGGEMQMWAYLGLSIIKSAQGFRPVSSPAAKMLPAIVSLVLKQRHKHAPPPPSTWQPERQNPRQESELISELQITPSLISRAG